MAPDKNRFLELVMQHRKIIYKICHAYCRDGEDRQDLEQEILVHLWRSAEKYDGRVGLSTWIYRVALNTAISFWRREKSRRARLTPVDREIIERVEDEREPEELADNIRLLYGFIDRLDGLNRALMLLYLDDRPQQEIAEILGISRTNVATKVGRIKERLRREFDAKAESP